jgi:hypothetical protein
VVKLDLMDILVEEDQPAQPAQLEELVSLVFGERLEILEQVGGLE